MTAAAFDGAVLCGGASRRMGRDKALIEIDGVAMARRVADALWAAGATDVGAVGGDEVGLAAVGMATGPDRWPGEGPLGGVVTALRSIGRQPFVAVLACDLVEPDPGAIVDGVRTLDSGTADVAVPLADGRPQWVHGVWRRNAADELERRFLDGCRSIHEAVVALRVATFDLADEDRLADADRPEDLVVRSSSGAPLRTIPAVPLPEIDVTALEDAQRAGAPVFDVRQPDEYEEAHVPGVQLVPLDEVPARMGEFPTDRTVYVICKSGGRSAKAVEFLRGNGVDAVNVAGGTMAWIDAGKPVDSGA